MGAMPSPDSASDLYGLPLDQFTPARGELVKRLKSEGNREEAAQVGKLRKPTLPAWAVNQLVRTQPKRIGALFEAGDAVAKAQTSGQANKLREAAAEQRDELAGLMARAEGLLDSEGRGLTASVLERVSETLRAAAIDPESRAQVADGCLTRKLQFTGLGGFSASAPSPSRAAKRGGQAEADERRRHEVKAAREEEGQAKRELKESQAELRQAEKQVAAAQRTRDKAAARVEQAQEALAEAGRRLKSAQRGGK